MRERRFKKPHTPRRVFLVICEGETEKAYVECLKRHYRLPITIRTKVSGNYINARLVEQYLKDEGLERPDDYRVFFIYDSDVQCVVDKLNTLTGDAVLTNPCIELWFLLHSKDYSRAQMSDVIVKQLLASHPVWQRYSKGMITSDQQRHLIDNRHQAIARANKLPWPGNPSSNMRLFIDALENEKNR